MRHLEYFSQNDRRFCAVLRRTSMERLCQRCKVKLPKTDDVWDVLWDCRFDSIWSNPENIAPGTWNNRSNSEPMEAWLSWCEVSSKFCPFLRCGLYFQLKVEVTNSLEMRGVSLYPTQGILYGISYVMCWQNFVVFWSFTDIPILASLLGTMSNRQKGMYE